MILSYYFYLRYDYIFVKVYILDGKTILHFVTCTEPLVFLYSTNYFNLDFTMIIQNSEFRIE